MFPTTTRPSQSIKIDIENQSIKSIPIDKLILKDIDFIGQSIKTGTRTPKKCSYRIHRWLWNRCKLSCFRWGSVWLWLFKLQMRNDHDYAQNVSVSFFSSWYLVDDCKRYTARYTGLSPARWFHLRTVYQRSNQTIHATTLNFFFNDQTRTNNTLIVLRFSLLFLR